MHRDATPHVEPLNKWIYSANYFDGYSARLHIEYTTPIPDPPIIVASDGEFTDRVRISWEACDGATDYYVYRNTVNNPDTASYRGNTSGLLYFYDTSALPGDLYYYWVKAHNANGN